MGCADDVCQSDPHILDWEWISQFCLGKQVAPRWSMKLININGKVGSIGNDEKDAPLEQLLWQVLVRVSRWGSRLAIKLARKRQTFEGSLIRVFWKKSLAKWRQIGFHRSGRVVEHYRSSLGKIVVIGSCANLQHRCNSRCSRQSSSVPKWSTVIVCVLNMVSEENHFWLLVLHFYITQSYRHRYD